MVCSHLVSVSKWTSDCRGASKDFLILPIFPGVFLFSASIITSFYESRKLEGPRFCSIMKLYRFFVMDAQFINCYFVQNAIIHYGAASAFRRIPPWNRFKKKCPAKFLCPTHFQTAGTAHCYWGQNHSHRLCRWLAQAPLGHFWPSLKARRKVCQSHFFHGLPLKGLT